LQKTLSDMNASKHKKREEELEEQMRRIEKDLRKKLEDFSDKLLKSTEEIKDLKVIFFALTISFYVIEELHHH